jgi:radical SAM superfamily enzyme YgiQ (UPF0313 family)
MIGLPSESEDDLDGIIDLSSRTMGLRKELGKGPAHVNISVNALVPKPHTPFQWFAMEPPENIKHKQDYLKKRIKDRRMRLSVHNPLMSFLEGVLSRGDRRLGSVVLFAFNKGSRFDAWDNSFVLNKWLDAFRESGVDPRFYLREKQKDELLPWDFIDVGISKEILSREYDKSIAIT